jgi:hypothetical protein
MAVRPQRMSLTRRKGFRLDSASRALNGLPAKIVARPGKWGNPFTIADVMARFALDRDAAQARAVVLHRQWLEGGLAPELSPGDPPPTRAELVAALGGHNLSCWCKPGTPCHADTLIALSNPPEATENSK